MENLWPLLVAAVFGVAVFIFGKGYFRKKEETPEETPTDSAIDTVGEIIQQTFEDAVGKIKADVEGDDPAGDLADQGNARRRE